MTGRRRRGGGPSLKIIKWRDIPAQVNGTAGDQKVQVELPPRFQKAIDRAAMVGDVKDANSYILQMGQEARPLVGDDVEVAVAALVAEIEEEFTLERLNQYVATGGWNPDADHTTLDDATIAAAEAGDELAIDKPNQTNQT
jgi:hypothetical protein